MKVRSSHRICNLDATSWRHDETDDWSGISAMRAAGAAAKGYASAALEAAMLVVPCGDTETFSEQGAV